jgi:PAS domain S-box-containing protein
MSLSSNPDAGVVSPLHEKMKLWSFYLVSAVGIVGACVLVGWNFDLAYLKRPMPVSPAMNPLTALSFILLSFSFLVLNQGVEAKWKNFLGLGLSLFVFVIAILRLINFFTSFTFEVDKVWFTEKLLVDVTSGASNRMASNTAFNFLLISFSILLLRSQRTIWRKIAQVTAILILLSSVFSIITYIYQVKEFYGLLSRFPMAIHTAICFLFFSIALLQVNTKHGLMKQLVSPLVGGLMGRILIPFAVTIPILLGYLRLLINWKIPFSTELGVASLIVSIVIIFILIIWSNVILLNKHDSLRQIAEEKLLNLNKELQTANEEMASANEELAALNEELLISNEQLNAANALITEQSDVIVRQKEEQFIRILDAVNDVVWSRDLTGKNNYLSQSAEKVFGQPYELLFNGEMTFNEFVHPDDISIKNASLHQLRSIGNSECTYRIILPDGKITWIYDRRQLIKDEHGVVIREEGVATDITSFKQHQYNVELIFSNIPETFILLDNTFSIIAFNRVAQQRAMRDTGFQLKEGENILNLIPKHEREHTKARIESAFADEVVSIESGPPNASDDGPFYLLNYFPIKVDGKVTHIVITATDITSKKLSENKLEHEHNLLRTLIDNLPDYIYVKDKDFKHLLNNRANVELLGELTEADTLGKSVFDYMPKDLAEKYIEDDRKVLESGKPLYNREELIQVNNGTTRWLLTTKVPLKNKAREIIGLVGISRDITKRKEAEQQIEASEKRFRALIENISDAIVLNDENSQLIYQSPSVTKILGYEIEERLGKKVSDYIHEDDKQNFIDLYEKLKQNPGKPHAFLYRFRHKRGHFVWLEGVITNLLHDPSVKAYVANYRDTTERKNLEEEIKSNQRNLDTLINNTKDLIWLIDKEHKLVMANKAFEAMMLKRFKVKVEIGQIILSNAEYNEEYEKWYFRYQRVLKGEQFIVEENIIDDKGKNNYSEVALNPIYDEQLNVIGAGCFSRDITERKYIEQKLKYFIEQYDIVSMATNDAIWDWYLETDTIVWNHGLKTIFGYEERDITYSRVWRAENVHPDDREIFLKEVDETFQDKKANFSLTYRFRCSNGIYKYVFDRAYVIYENDKPRRMIGAIQDIDDRMGNLEEVKKLSLVASKTENAVAITDKNNKIEWTNNSFTRQTGYTLREIIGQRPSDFLYGDETDLEVSKKIDEKLEKGESVSEELVHYSKSGRKYWIKISITPIFNDLGQLDKFILIYSDVTEQKEYEKSITSIARELANLIEYANTPIFGIDRNGYINEWNGVTAELTGYTKNEVYGTKLLESFIDPKMWPILNEQLQKIFEGDSISNFELPIYTKNKDRLIVLLNATPRRNSSFEIVGAIIVGQNITELIEYRQNLEKKVEERTRALNESLQKEKELVEMKNKFVSMVSHEFRTPLSSISLASGFIKKYQKRISPEETETKLDNIEKQVRHMTFLLNDILTIGKSEAGKIQAQVTPLPLKPFLENLVKDVEQSTGGTHKVKLTIECPFDVIYSDEKLLRNIIINLLTNAIKFSPQKKLVTLQVDCLTGKLQIKMQDNGIGIAQEDLPNIFTAFHRGGNVGVVQGTGLGLSITKKAVDLLQGDIQVKSEIGQGTLFIITLPLNHDEKNSVG